MSDSGYASLGPTLLARKGGAKPAMRPQLPVLNDAAEVAKFADEQLEDLGWNDMGEDNANGDAGDDAGAPVVVPIDRATPFDAEAAAASPIVRRQQRRLEERVLADAVMTGPENLCTDNDDAPIDGELYGEQDDEAGADSAQFYNALHAEAHANDEAGYAAAPVHENTWADQVSEPEPLAHTHAVLATKPAQSAKPVRQAPAASARRAAFTLRLDPERHLKLRLAATMRGASAQALVTEALDAMLAEFEELDVIAAHLQRH